jgi:hypothetical protein
MQALALLFPRNLFAAALDQLAGVSRVTAGPGGRAGAGAGAAGGGIGSRYSTVLNLHNNNSAARSRNTVGGEPEAPIQILFNAASRLSVYVVGRHTLTAGRHCTCHAYRFSVLAARADHQHNHGNAQGAPKPGRFGAGAADGAGGGGAVAASHCKHLLALQLAFGFDVPVSPPLPPPSVLQAMLPSPLRASAAAAAAAGSGGAPASRAAGVDASDEHDERALFQDTDDESSRALLRDGSAAALATAANGPAAAHHPDGALESALRMSALLGPSGDELPARVAVHASPCRTLQWVAVSDDILLEHLLLVEA